MPVPARNHPIHALALILLAVSALVRGQEPAATPGELLDRGDHEGAIALLETYAQQYEGQLAEAHDDPALGKRLASVLIWRGTLELDLTRSRDAIASFSRARELLATDPVEARLMGTCLDGLGRAFHHAGEYRSALPVLEEALSHRLTLPDEQRVKWAPATREHLGLLLLAMGRYEESAVHLQQSLADTPEADPGARAQRHASLGRLFHTLRSYAKAREHLNQALALAEQAWGRENPNTFMLLDQLGLTLLRQGETAEARAALEEATALAQAQSDTVIGGIRFATILNNYGNLLIEEHDGENAQGAFLQALEGLEATLGADHPALAPIWNNLGYTSLEQDQHEVALDYFRQARDSYLSHVGPLHQRSVEALTNLALASYLSGHPDAREETEAAALAHQKMIPKLLSFGTETQRLNYLQRIDPLSVPCSAGQDPALIADTLIRTKGRLLDALLRKPDAADPHPDDPGWREVQEQLIPGSAFVDFVRYLDYGPDSDLELTYGAVVILPEGIPQWIQLGTEESLLSWMGAVQDRLAWRSTQLGQTAATGPPPPLKLKPALRRIHREFWAPVAEVLPPDTRTLALSPDSSLNFLSFATLLDEDHRFFCQHYPLAVYFSSGRDLLHAPSATSLTGRPWSVFSVKEFSPPPLSDTPGNLHDQQLRDTLSHLHPIHGAEHEVHVLKRHFAKGSQVFREDQATEEQLRKIDPSPGVLHLVTHGFFLPGNPDPDPRLADFDESPNRLRRSGLVLHGASAARTDSINDGILFANEVATLPLAETRLVTLSSCDSGLGENLAGEGVLGLRRGFALAGARNLLLTLWPVSDASTPEFMRRFYQLAIHTNHLGQAAWQTQSELLTPIDRANEAALEEAVLRYGPFVLCQREALQEPAASIPPPQHAHGSPLRLALFALAGLSLLIGIGKQMTRPR